MSVEWVNTRSNCNTNNVTRVVELSRHLVYDVNDSCEKFHFQALRGEIICLASSWSREQWHHHTDLRGRERSRNIVSFSLFQWQSSRRKVTVTLLHNKQWFTDSGKCNQQYTDWLPGKVDSTQEVRLIRLNQVTQSDGKREKREREQSNCSCKTNLVV